MVDKRGKPQIPMGEDSNSSNRPRKELEKYESIKEYRRKASREASKANKRIQRLSKSEFKDSPAYQKWIAEGGNKFSVKGKSYNEVQKEMARIREFIDSETSTITGIKNHLKDMAKQTGIKYKNFQELKKAAPKFFELSSKVEQYLRTVDDMASAVGYQRIWEVINQYTKDENIDLANTEKSIDSMVQSVTNALTEFETPVTAGGHSAWVKIYGENNN